jgi:Ca-activated chloride channel family protein
VPASARHCALWLTFALAGLPGHAAESPLEERVGGYYSRWLEDVAPLASVHEREVFSELIRDAERERFIEGFWAARGTAARRRFYDNLAQAEQVRPRSRAEREAILLAGKPRDVVFLPECGGARRELVLWTYSPWHVTHQTGDAGAPALALLFVQTTPYDPRTLRLYSARERRLDPLGGETTVDARTLTLDLGVARRCAERGEHGDALARALERGPGRDELVSVLGWPRPDEGWLDVLLGAADRGLAETAVLIPQLAVGAPVVSDQVNEVALVVAFPGSYAGTTLLEGRFRLPTALLQEPVAGSVLDRFELLGDLLRDGRLLDTFTITFHVAGAAPSGDQLELAFYRRLRPGTFRLRLRLADAVGRALLRSDVEVSVPEVAVAAPEPMRSRQGYATLTKSEVVSLVTFPRVEILPPSRRAVGAMVEIETVTVGGPFAAVELGIDGRFTERDEEAPYRAALALGGGGHRLTARALDAAGNVVASDELFVERRSEDFQIHLLALERDGQRHAVAEVVVPYGDALARLDCFWNRRLHASRTAPPWECELPAQSAELLPYLRAVATTTGGRSVEDVLFYAGRAPEEIDVQLVELLLSAVDAHGRPIASLSPQEVHVYEEGREQTLVSCVPLDDLPLAVALLMDVSSSLGRRVRTASESAQSFFDDLLRPEDQASLLTFNHDVRQVTAFTADTALLRYGAEGLRAFGATRLYDSMAYALFTFSGLGPRRALVVLSDGADTGSDLGFEQVLEEAIRARVAVYPIALGVVRDDGSQSGGIDDGTLTELRTLAERTGGGFQQAATVEDLDAAYRRIVAELRAQHQVVYRPQRSGETRDLALVEVRIDRPGARARFVRGSGE